MSRIYYVLLSVLMCVLLGGAQTYVGPEKCLTCHGGLIGSDKSGWRTTLHANGYSAVLDSSKTMQDLFGVICDYNGNGVDDFIDGLDFNTISSVFDPYKPNAPVLAYSDAAGYTITIGELTMRVYLTYGGSGLFKQRYAVKVPCADGESADLYISPIQYNEKTDAYVLYHADAWYDGNNAPIYTSASTKADISGNSRSFTKGCSGCHVTGIVINPQDANGEWTLSGGAIDPATLDKYTDNNIFDLNGDGTPEQMNTGCERCHGPGGDHVTSLSKDDIINPATDLTPEQATNMCGMCHSRGHSKPDGTFSFAYHDDTMQSWAPGELVNDVYSDGGGYWGDNNADTQFRSSKQHHQQFRDYIQSDMEHNVADPITCFNCHDPHGSKNEHMIVEEMEEEGADGNPIVIPTDVDNNTLCLSCHSTEGDFAGITKEMVADYANNITAIGAVVSLHSHHPYDPEGTGASRCTKCHMPKVAKSAIEYDIHSHSFEVIPPEKTKLYAMPNACAVSCHMKAGYDNFGVDFTSDVLGDWTEATDLQLADSLMKYYGPGGMWWDYSVTAIDVAVSNEIPTKFSLSQNYPNPFNPTTTIKFSLPVASHVRLTIYNILGKEIATIVNGLHPAGVSSVTYDASNLANGVYIYQLVTSNQKYTKKMVLMK